MPIAITVTFWIAVSIAFYVARATTAVTLLVGKLAHPIAIADSLTICVWTCRIVLSYCTRKVL